MWTVDCVHIARNDDETVVDSIPLAEALSVSVSGEEAAETPQYLTAANWTLNFLRFSKNTPSVHPVADGDQESNPPSQGLKRMQSTTRKRSSKAVVEEKPDEAEAILQIATIEHGFNSGLSACLYPHTWLYPHTGLVPHSFRNPPTPPSSPLPAPQPSQSLAPPAPPPPPASQPPFNTNP